MMKKHSIFCMATIILTLSVQPALSDQPYQVTNSQLLSIKDIMDDPSPFYTKTQYWKTLIPSEVYDKCVYDTDEMKRLWPEIVGLKAPDVVGKLSPEIKPGKYTLADKEKLPFKDLMPEYFFNKFNEPGEGCPNTIGNFTEFEVVPTRQYYRTLPLAKAAKQYLGSVKQDSEGYIDIDTYKGGLPFPRPSGEHKAMQIIYNWSIGYGFANWESTVLIDNVFGVNKNWQIDHRGSGIEPFLTTVGRVDFAPHGWFDKRAEEQKESNILMYSVLAPRDIYGNKYLGVGYIQPDKDSITLAYVNILRRVRKLSSTDRQDQAVGQDMAYDDSWGFQQQMNPKIYPYEYKIIEEREFLVPALALEGDAYIDSKENFKFKNLKFERRPIWVVEMKQKDPNYIYSKRIWYVDQETLMPVAWLMYDQKGRLYRTFIPYHGFIPQMGVINFFQWNNEDYVDTHSTFSWSTGYPNPYLDRADVSLQSVMKAK